MKIRPLDDRIVIEPIEAAAKTPGGIMLPDQARERPQSGLVIAVGPGRLLENGVRLACSVKNGDEVYFAPYAGSELELEGSKVRIMHESDILGVVEK